ncbi:SagB family peptide dehydrogenase [Parageobacillus thermoglucosidasius]|uniref:SagB family peptide dehydrogenase n=1 Tax=Parageobacillus thermoglucosidasius TaxID=1426 RepID=UPI000E182D32|nr:SagB family peptide dehydrogenase [Parageobacillus thermoglucosidasius]MED4906241.1 SagB family peptide dehydrogenase [Parageobacillus thermoglucosidasius]MED4915478.1 SagB family peptide dehydrogenase [Parageobacillus thermoglucosidasius]MED4945846.1 SagB family peptide dehydrogenase [Parageobacillus thermoglucosidasius]MED4984325.1 SagB family peptide dehydrogenase [Parageobacillus thermoglucosidasius]RDE28638.1 SagB/ThcOx family dehydrogenase [Parageobacillus thermoglucosidasius]
MKLDTFLHHLHFDIDKIMPPDWEVDWEDAPLPYKLYRNLPVIPLSSEIPLTFEGREAPEKLDLEGIGHFLWYVFGLTQFCQLAFSMGPTEQAENLMHLYRRFVPSGGALYPNELYVYLKMEDVSEGVYHYDVAHHRLVLLREGNFDSYLTRALGNRCDVSACFGIVFVSTMFWKNFFKYNNFAYRLQGLDAGVLIGQLLEVAKQFGFASTVYFQFLDRAINHLLGLSEQEESVYAVIALSVESFITWFANDNNLEENVSATELCRQLPAVQHHYYIRSRRIIDYPMLRKMNEASMLESSRSFRQIKRKKKDTCGVQAVVLPCVKRLSYDLASVCQKRYSPGMDFVLEKVSQEQLATLLQEATLFFTYRNDLDGEYEKPPSRVSLYGCFYNVEDVPNGAYYYDSAVHALRRIRSGDYRHYLQYGMSMDNVNLFQVPLCLHVLGDRDHLQMELGYRGYRIQQMEAGMLVQRLLLVASAMGMGGHPLLGFDVNLCDKLYKIDSRWKTSLIQIPIGPYRPRAWLKGSLRS